MHPIGHQLGGFLFYYLHLTPLGGRLQIILLGAPNLMAGQLMMYVASPTLRCQAHQAAAETYTLITHNATMHLVGLQYMKSMHVQRNQWEKKIMRAVQQGQDSSNWNAAIHSIWPVRWAAVGVGHGDCCQNSMTTNQKRGMACQLFSCPPAPTGPSQQPHSAPLRLLTTAL